MPFHSWIPDAAVDAPLPFMALDARRAREAARHLLPGPHLARPVRHRPGWASTLLMMVGAVTILLAVLMALVQKDFKRLLSFHAISQVGYMILGIGTGDPVGIVGGLFHMVNHAMYKSTLFLTGGAVERQAGTTDLERLGGLARRRCRSPSPASSSRPSPSPAFPLQRLLLQGAGLRRRAGARAGSSTPPRRSAPSSPPPPSSSSATPPSSGRTGRRERGAGGALAMLVPMIVIAAACLLFGVGNVLPIDAPHRAGAWRPTSSRAPPLRRRAASWLLAR